MTAACRVARSFTGAAIRRARRLRRAGLAAALLAATLAPGGGALPAANVAHAEQRELPARPPPATRRTPTLRNHVFEQLAAAQKAAEAGDFAAAQRLLEALTRERGGEQALNSYELANVYNFYAFIYYEQRRYQDAIAAYGKVLAQPGLPAAMETGTRYSLAQLYFVTEDWKRAATMLESWFRVAPEPAPEAYILLAQAQYRLEDYDRALRNVEAGMAAARRHGQEPRENWYLLARAIHYDKGDLRSTAGALETLARKWPKKDYFVQLSGIYGELKDDKAQLAALETAYLSGWLTSERELVNLAYLYLSAGTPIKAARVLDAGMQAGQIEAGAANLELLGVALRQARENREAIPYLARAAAVAGDGESWARLASIQLDEDASKDAVKSARKALSLGGGRRPDNTRIVLGMALYNLGRYEEARTAFTEARRDARSEKIASQWLRFLDAEIERARRLAQDA
jgi:tetratricopeptide (TPR) repeat protein